ncbi:MAG: hypothetical protein R6W87_09010 [Halospina sp.]
MSGPQGLRHIRGFKDEALSGKWKGFRSVRLGVDRAKVLARALRCHPAVLVFPGWNVEYESAA